MTQDAFMGLAVSALCLLGLRETDRLLEVSRMARQLVASQGKAKAQMIVRALLMIGLVFGLSLAMGLIKPMAH